MRIAQLRKNERYGDWEVINVLEDEWIEKNAPHWKTEGVYQPQLENDVEMHLEIEDMSVMEVGDIYDPVTKLYSKNPPRRAEKEAKLARKSQIEAELNSLDFKLIRPLVVLADPDIVPTTEDLTVFKALTAEKTKLRAELQALGLE